MRVRWGSSGQTEKYGYICMLVVSCMLVACMLVACRSSQLVSGWLYGIVHRLYNVRYS